MCVGITPPCSKCGAPARYKQMLEAAQKANIRLLNVSDYVRSLADDCPMKREITDILEGRSK